MIGLLGGTGAKWFMLTVTFPATGTDYTNWGALPMGNRYICETTIGAQKLEPFVIRACVDGGEMKRLEGGKGMPDRVERRVNAAIDAKRVADVAAVEAENARREAEYAEQQKSYKDQQGRYERQQDDYLKEINGGVMPKFKSCTEARAAGKQNIKRGTSDYSVNLDRDGNGVGCESFAAKK